MHGSLVLTAQNIFYNCLRVANNRDTVQMPCRRRWLIRAADIHEEIVDGAQAGSEDDHNRLKALKSARVAGADLFEILDTGLEAGREKFTRLLGEIWPGRI